MKNRLLICTTLAGLALSSTARAAVEKEVDAPPTNEPTTTVVWQPTPANGRIGQAPATPAPAPSAESLAYFSRAFDWSDSFGNTSWGGAYGIHVAVTATDAAVEGTGHDVLRVNGRAYADARVFGQTRNVLEVRGKAFAIESEAFGAEIDLLVMGFVVKHEEIQGTLPKTWTKHATFFNAATTFTLGPIPINVSANVSGTAELTIDGGVTDGLFHASVTPHAFAVVTASASAGVSGVAEVGITGSVTIADLALPTHGELRPLEGVGRRIEWSLTSDLDANFLAGTLELFARVIGFEYRMRIAEWNGFPLNRSIVDIGGTYQERRTVPRL